MYYTYELWFSTSTEVLFPFDVNKPETGLAMPCTSTRTTTTTTTTSICGYSVRDLPPPPPLHHVVHVFFFLPHS